MSMTVEQAIAVVIESLSGARYAEGMAALSVIRSHIERGVDDAMVGRAVNAYTRAEFDDEFMDMHAALHAALGGDDA